MAGGPLHGGGYPPHNRAHIGAETPAGQPRAALPAPRDAGGDHPPGLTPGHDAAWHQPGATQPPERPPQPPRRRAAAEAHTPCPGLHSRPGLRAPGRGAASQTQPAVRPAGAPPAPFWAPAVCFELKPPTARARARAAAVRSAALHRRRGGRRRQNGRWGGGGGAAVHSRCRWRSCRRCAARASCGAESRARGDKMT